MRVGAIISLIFGILLLIGGIILLVFYGIGDANSEFSGEQNIGYGYYWHIGGKSASKIKGEYSSSGPVDVYVTSDESVTGFLWSLDDLDDLTALDKGKTEGTIDYETPDSSKEYYLIFTNPNDSNINVNTDVEFQNEGLSMICLIPGIISLIIGVVLLIVGAMLAKKGKVAASQFPAYSPPSGPPATSSSVPIQPGYQPGYQSSDQSTMQSTTSSYTYSEQETTCPQCHRPLNFLMQYNKWYCNTCQKYY